MEHEHFKVFRDSQLEKAVIGLSDTRIHQAPRLRVVYSPTLQLDLPLQISSLIEPTLN